ncbi:hypothetical protein Tco_1557798, partial [Tanacetum coccineum]
VQQRLTDGDETVSTPRGTTQVVTRGHLIIGTSMRCACVSTRSGVYGSMPIIGNHEAVGGVQKDYNTHRSSNMSGGVLERTKLPLPLGGYKWSTQELFEEENLELDLVY